MVMSPRKVEIRDGTITLPEDMLEESGIGTSDGMVNLLLDESGDIVVRPHHAANDRPDAPSSSTWTVPPEPDAEQTSTEYQLWLVQSTAGILHEYIDDVIVPPGVSHEDLPSHWRRLAEEAIADAVMKSMEDAGHEDNIH
ncbi:MAG: hypothetical protein ACTHQE_17640 [Thermomicrobiales bacterium]